MTMNTLGDLAEWVSALERAHIPAVALETARRAFLDTFGVTLLGSRSQAARIVAKTAFETGAAAGPCSLVGFGCRADLLNAALVNGTSAHADLFDDNNAPMVAHPSAPLVSALLPLAQARHIGGAAVLTAYCAGFEVGVTLGRMLNPALYEAGWHVTRVLGVIGTAAAAARLLRLDASRTAHAMAITASMASGIRQAFGTMTMALHVGLTARDGIHAALLAEAGFGADPGALNGRFGLFRLFAGAKEAGPVAMGQPFELVRSGIIFKPYPSGAPTHAAIDCALALAARLRRDDITEVVCLVHPWNAITLRDEAPRDPLQAKVSLRFCVAAALARRQVTYEEFTDSALADPYIARLMDRIVVRISDELPDNGEFPAELRIVTAAGTVESERRDVPRGGSTVPLTTSELEGKFQSCARVVLDPSVFNRIPPVVAHLDDLADVGELAAILEGNPCL
jgi:2-methylcitrate dehydratase PrpD